MPKRTAKKPVKKSAAPKAKTTLKKKTAAKPAPPGKKGFMWKLLERKQAELKHATGPHKHPFAHAEAKSSFMPTQQGQPRFNGPRRKAA